MIAEEKLSAIERVENGESKTAVAHSIGIAESTFRGWCKSEQKIRSKSEYLAHSNTVPPSCRNIAPPSPATTMQINTENTVHPNGKWEMSNRDVQELDAAVPRKRARMEREVLSTATTSTCNTSRLPAPYHDKIRSLLVKNPALKNLVHFDSKGKIHITSHNYETSKQQAISFLSILNASMSSDVSSQPENNQNDILTSNEKENELPTSMIIQSHDL